MYTLPPDNTKKTDTKQILKVLKKSLFLLQNKLHAQAKNGLLVVLQGTDTSGKDGVIRHVFSCMNPTGIRVTSFKKPTEIELKHDFLWRIYPHFPAKGAIAIFNRSYFEDILVPLRLGIIDDETLQHRVNLINTIENHLQKSGITVLKFHLVISKEEQQKRIQERINNPEKQWKLSPEDMEINEQWEDQQSAYNYVTKHCNDIPWISIPADKKWYRNYLVAKHVEEAMLKITSA